MYFAVATLLVSPIAIAVALMVSLALTLIGTVYLVDESVGAVPLVV